MNGANGFEEDCGDPGPGAAATTSKAKAAKADAGGKANGTKRLSVERIYQKKSQLEHILLRPDTYIGSVNPVTEKMWVLDSATQQIVNKEITYVPGLYKIFDEILVNAADNKVRDAKMDTIKIDIHPERNEIKVYNNGKGIPVEHHKVEKMFVPTLIFGHLLTSSNFNDEEEKVTGGRNGYGAKLCNVFSTKFTVETASKENKKDFRQSWANNMSKAGEPKIKDFSGEDYTRITFYPDLPKFNMTTLDSDTVSLLSRRAYDVAASGRGVKVFLNGKKIPVKNFKDYVDLFLKGHEDETGNQIKCMHEVASDRWEIAIAVSDNGFQQMSFVNSIATTKGGRHVDYVSKMIEANIAEILKKKNKGGVTIKPHQIRNHLWVFINCLIVNPTFDSQTKENMTLQQSKFGSKCQLTPKFFQQVQKSGIVESVLAWSKFKADQEMKSKHSSKKTNKLKGIAKLEDANNAGTKHSLDCTLILTEGDSAKTLAVAGLSVLGRDIYGVYPLRGKLLNVREATHKQIMENKEINEMVKIIGLQYKKKYLSVDDLKTLRYGKLMIMTDQDQDGSHIKGLLINFIHHNWPTLLQLPFLEEFITPIVKASKGGEERSFFSLPEFNEWKAATNNWHTYKIKYYKGLGTSTSKEAKEYFSDMKRHRILFDHQSEQDDHSINMAFSKKAIEQRKEWLTSWMEEGKRRKELGLPEVYLYEKNTKSVTYSDFVNKELVLFSNLDNERSIPSIVDGFKPGQRKVMFTCLKRNDKREVKVAQLAGSVGEMSAYHHGEASLMGTIINLAQDYVGSNNINLLLPIGQFGTRLAGGKDHASPRYIFTQMSPLARLIFNAHDDAILNYLKDDNQKIEPEWYVPIIPMILVNGADGIGTGWMTKIPNYNPREIVKNLRRILDGLEPQEMTPWFKGFQGEIDSLGDQRFVINGEIASVSDNKVEITELPIRTWTQTYKEQVMEPYLNGAEKQPAVIQDYKEYHTDKTVKFVVQMDKEKLRSAEIDKGLHQFFKLQTTLSTSSMVLFDARGCLKRYDDATEIIKEFFELRLEYYEKRKDYLEGMMEAEALKLSNQARFILEKCDGSLVVENKRKKVMIEDLQRKGFDSDPVKKWKKSQDEDAREGSDSDDEEEDTDDLDYDYLLGMAMWCLTLERKEELLRKKNEKQQELSHLKSMSKEALWRKDLDEFLVKLDEVEEKEKEDSVLHSKKDKGKGVKKKVHADFTPAGIRIVPRVAEALRTKVAKAAAAKDKKGEKKMSKATDEKDEFDMMCDDREMNKSLSEKLGFNLPKAKKGKTLQKKKGSSDEDLSDDEPLLSTKAKKGKTLKKKRDSSSDEDLFDDEPLSSPKAKRGKLVKYKDDSSDDSSDDDFTPTAIHIVPHVAEELRTKIAKPAAAKDKKDEKKISKATEEKDEFDMMCDDNLPKANKGKTLKKKRDSSSDEDLFDDEPLPSPKAKKGKPVKKKDNFSDEDSDADFMPAKNDIVPRVAGALKTAKPTAAKDKKVEKKISKATDKKDDFDMMCDDREINKSLSDKLGFNLPKAEKGKTLQKKKGSSDEDLSDDEPLLSTKAKKGKTLKKKKGSSDEDLSDDEPLLSTKAKKGKTLKKKKKGSSDEDLSDDEPFLSTKAKKGKTVKKKVDSSDEDYLIDEPSALSSDGDLIVKKQRTAKAKINYNFDSDSDSDTQMY